MRKLAKFGIGIMVVIVVLVGLWTYHTHGIYEKSYRSEYHYGIRIESDSILHNVTLFVPLPVFEEESKIGDEIMVGNASKPDDWDCNIVETEYGKMLKISAEKISFRPPPPPFLPLPPPGEKPPNANASNYVPSFSEGLSVNVDAGHYINIINPVGNEPLLSPRYNVTETYSSCYEYESYIYSDYTATSPNATVRISVSMDGTNEWYYRRGDVLKGGGNAYIDRVNVTLSEEQHGWHIASGELDENLVVVSAGMSAGLEGR